MKEIFLNHKLDNMSLKEKIGQLIIIDYRNTLEMTQELEQILTKYQPGGFILFKSNIANFKQTNKLLNDIKNTLNIPIMTAIDQEGGRVQRLDERVGFEKYPSAQELGQTLDENAIFEFGRKMGAQLKSIGIDMDMAPVLDIFSNPQNKVIGDRAFGSDSKIVTKKALAYAEGLKKENIIAVGKHFPGHGDTITDSHLELPIIEKSLSDLQHLELIPFIAAIKQNIPGLMIAHVALPEITKNSHPATLSNIIINRLLRNTLGYNGLVITDSLQMKSLTKNFTNSEIYFRCIEAGNDLLLMPEDISEACLVLYQQVNAGIIPEERINHTVYRILSTKFDYGLLADEYHHFLQTRKVRSKRI